MIATGAPSLTVSPSLTRSFSSTPSSSMLKSMFALSVSTSATRSPGETLSPSFFVHRTRTPSSIVGDSFGKPMIWATLLLRCSGLGVGFVAFLGLVRGLGVRAIGQVQRALDRGDDILDLRLDLVLEVLGVRHRHVVAGHPLDRRV